jgi:hypothetical protein
MLAVGWRVAMTLGLAERQGRLGNVAVQRCEAGLPERSIYRLLHAERDRLFPALDPEPPAGQGQRDPPAADGQLQRPCARTGQAGEERHGRRRVGPRGQVLVGAGPAVSEERRIIKPSHDHHPTSLG